MKYERVQVRNCVACGIDFSPGDEVIQLDNGKDICTDCVRRADLCMRSARGGFDSILSTGVVNG